MGVCGMEALLSLDVINIIPFPAVWVARGPSSSWRVDEKWTFCMYDTCLCKLSTAQTTHNDKKLPARRTFFLGY